MANPEHLAVLARGVREWNEWRRENPGIEPDLRNADLGRAYLRKANLSHTRFDGARLGKATMSKADLRGANLTNAHLRAGHLRMAVLEEADLSNANLQYAVLADANVSGATLTGCSVYGVAAWNLKGKPKTQLGLRISRDGDPVLTVDDMEVAQFIHLLLTHSKLRNVVDAVTHRGVLLLGRFGGGGLEMLRALAEVLRSLNYLPIIFDFDRPSNKDYLETIKTLTGLSRFVIADLSGPSVPLELAMTVPFFKVPYAFVIDDSRVPFSMHKDLLAYPWVINPVTEFTAIEFSDLDKLKARVSDCVVGPAEKLIAQRRSQLDNLYGSL